MAVGQHVELVPRVPLRLLLGLRQRRLVTWSQLDVDLHFLQRPTVQSDLLIGPNKTAKGGEIRRITSSLVSLFSRSRGSCLTCVAMAKAARSWLSARLMTLVMEGSMEPWQLVPMTVCLSQTASSS